MSCSLLHASLTQGVLFVTHKVGHKSKINKNNDNNNNLRHAL